MCNLMSFHFISTYKVPALATVASRMPKTTPILNTMLVYIYIEYKSMVKQSRTLSDHVHVYPYNLRGHRQEPDHIQNRHKSVQSASELPSRTESLPSDSDSSQMTHKLVNRRSALQSFEVRSALQSSAIEQSPHCPHLHGHW